MGRNKGDKDKGPRRARRKLTGYAGTKLWGLETAPLSLGAAHSSTAALVFLTVYERAVLDAQGRVAALGGERVLKSPEKIALRRALTEDAKQFLEEVHSKLPAAPRPNFRPRVDADELARCVVLTIGNRVKERLRRA